MAQVRRLGPKVGSHLVLCCIHWVIVFGPQPVYNRVTPVLSIFGDTLLLVTIG